METSRLSLRNPALLCQACLVGGDWITAQSGKTITVKNPADGSTIGQVPELSGAEVDAAIQHAAEAWPAWRSKTAASRAGHLRRWFDLMLANQDDLAMLMTAEQGKPLSESKAEIRYAASFIEWFAEEAKRVYGETIPSPQAENRVIVTREPVGVCAAITPWNFPAAMITRKAAPALAAGCVIVIKPAGQTPLSALALGVLAQEAGIPAGVLQVVTGSSREIGATLTSSPVVRKLSFTGSTEVGRELMHSCAPTLKRLSLELGGNAPFIVFDDADLDQAVEGALASKFRNAGQTCVCANRLLVQEGIYDAFLERLSARVSHMTVGDGREAGTEIGPLINAGALEKVEEHVADALALGARLAVGGKRDARGGLFYQPTVLADATPAMKIFREETFGPVAPLFRFKTEAEAIKLANDTEFGLAAYFYSIDLRRSARVAEALEYGIIGHNTGLISSEVVPFGGVKQSGFGREGSRHGIDEYLQLKYLCSNVSQADSPLPEPTC